MVISLPKSATIYCQRSFELTLSLAHCRITSGFDIDEEALHRFMEQPMAVASDHTRATDRNLRLVAEAGIRRIAIMVRDPRDAMVSLWHHLEREDMKSQPWLIDALAERGISREYFRLPPERKLAEHIKHTFPHYQRWLAEWGQALDAPSPFEFHLRRYEDFAQDPARSLRQMHRFFGYDNEPILPDLKGTPAQLSAGIDMSTHFRRGIVGSHRDELPAHLRSRLNALADPRLFERFGWVI